MGPGGRSHSDKLLDSLLQVIAHTQKGVVIVNILVYFPTIYQ